MRGYFFFIRESLLAFVVSISHEEALVWRNEITGHPLIFLDESTKVVFVDPEDLMVKTVGRSWSRNLGGHHPQYRWAKELVIGNRKRWGMSLRIRDTISLIMDSFPLEICPTQYWRYNECSPMMCEAGQHELRQSRREEAVLLREAQWDTPLMKNEDESKEVAGSDDDVPRSKDVFSWVILAKWSG